MNQSSNPYSLPIANPLQSAMEGYTSYLGLQNQQMATAANMLALEEAKRNNERKLAFQSKMAELVKQGNPSTDEIVKASIEYPEYTEALMKDYNALNDQQKTANANLLGQVFEGLLKDDLDKVEVLLQTRKEAAKNSGMKKEEAGADAMLQILQNNNKDVKNSLLLHVKTGLIHALGPEAFKVLYGKYEKTTRPLTAEEIASVPNLDRNKPYQVTEGGKIEQIGNAGTNVSVNVKNEGPIPEGYRVVRDASGNPVSMEPIEGGPAAVAKNVEKGLERRGKDIVNSSIDSILSKVYNGKFLTGVFSDLANKSGLDVRQSNKDLDVELSKLKSVLTIQTLNELRKSSKTGASGFGSLTEKEMGVISSSLANLDRGQGKKQFIKQVKDLKSLVNDVVNGVYSPNKASITPNSGKPTSTYNSKSYLKYAQ